MNLDRFAYSSTSERTSLLSKKILQGDMRRGVRLLL